MDVINFYSPHGEYGAFSNFAPYPIYVNGKTYRTSEHYFQSQKFLDSHNQEKVRTAESPKEAALLGRDRRMPLRSDWESVKLQIMLDALRAKFRQHPKLADLLISTGDAVLVEHTEKDSFWGDGGNGKGKNALGKLLMKVRKELTTKYEY